MPVAKQETPLPWQAARGWILNMHCFPVQCRIHIHGNTSLCPCSYGYGGVVAENRAGRERGREGDRGKQQRRGLVYVRRTGRQWGPIGLYRPLWPGRPVQISIKNFELQVLPRFVVVSSRAILICGERVLPLTFDDSIRSFRSGKGMISSRSFDRKRASLVNVGSQDYSLCVWRREEEYSFRILP